MASVTADAAESGPPLGADRVDPRAPRFGQAITAALLALGIALRAPALVAAVAAILWVAVLSDWKVDLYGLLWRYAMIPIVGRPREREPAAPHRFAKLVGATFTLAAVVLLAADVALVGYAIAGLVALLAAVAAVFDLCLGCKMYRQVSFFRNLGWV